MLEPERVEVKKKRLTYLQQIKKLAKCIDKAPLTHGVACRIAKQSKEVVPYRCEFCHKWHVGNTLISDHKMKRLNRREPDDLI